MICRISLTVFCAVMLVATARAQSDDHSIPDAPSAVRKVVADDPQQGGSSTSIAEYKRPQGTVNPGDNQPPSLTTEQKFNLMLRRAVSVPALVIPLAEAGISHARDEYPEWGSDGEGFAKRYGAELADAQARNFLHTFVFASMFRQDPRYFRKANGTAGERLGYAMSRILVTRGDNGNAQPNASLILASLASAALQNAYLPQREQTGGDTAIRFGRNLGVQMGVNVVREFLPSLRKIIR